MRLKLLTVALITALITTGLMAKSDTKENNTTASKPSVFDAFAKAKEAFKRNKESKKRAEESKKRAEESKKRHNATALVGSNY